MLVPTARHNREKNIMNTSIYATNYPLFTGMGVTRGHANYCEDHGHASYVVDGADQGICPRCLESTTVSLTEDEIDDLVSANDPTLYAEYYAPAAAPRTPRYVQVNIGRNVGNEPMSDLRWGTFQDDIAMAIVNATAGTLPNVNVHTGEGFWNDERTGELLSEESAYLSTFADVDLFALRKTLATLKRQYQQDAIALIAGSDLI